MSKYYLFLDECGDQNLANFDPSFPIFTLCGIVLSQEQLDIVTAQIDVIKKRFWNDKKIILHSRDIRKCEKGFEVLFDLSTKQQFYQAINEVLAQKIYTIICCAILKEPYIRKYGKMNDVYAQSLSFIVERTVFYLDSVSNQDAKLNVVIEKRGKKEDDNLLNYYNQLLDRGTYFVKPERIKNYFESFEMKWKSQDVVGLQVADLIAYPLTRYILDEQAANPAFEIVKDNIYTDERGKLYGLKIFP